MKDPGDVLLKTEQAGAPAPRTQKYLALKQRFETPQMRFIQSHFKLEGLDNGTVTMLTFGNKKHVCSRVHPPQRQKRIETDPRLKGQTKTSATAVKD